jgi:hypothetical protein
MYGQSQVLDGNDKNRRKLYGPETANFVTGLLEDGNIKFRRRLMTYESQRKI